MQSTGSLFLFFLLPLFFFFFTSPILVISFPPCLDISDMRCIYLIFSCCSREMQQFPSFHSYILDLNTPHLTSPHSSCSSASAISTPCRKLCISSCVFHLVEGFFFFFNVGTVTWLGWRFPFSGKILAGLMKDTLTGSLKYCCSSQWEFWGNLWSAAVPIVLYCFTPSSYHYESWAAR